MSVSVGWNDTFQKNKGHFIFFTNFGRFCKVLVKERRIFDVFGAKYRGCWLKLLKN
jgi:hypothetical protein